MKHEERMAYLQALKIPVWKLRTQDENQSSNVGSSRTEQAPTKAAKLFLVLQNSLSSVTEQSAVNALFEKMLAAILKNANLEVDECRIFYFSDVELSRHALEHYQITVLPNSSLRSLRTMEPVMEEASIALHTEIQKSPPLALLILGKSISQALLEEDFNHLNQTTTEILGNLPVFVTYSPADMLKNTALRSSIWQDFKKCIHFLHS